MLPSALHPRVIIWTAVITWLFIGFLIFSPLIGYFTLLHLGITSSSHAKEVMLNISSLPVIFAAYLFFLYLLYERPALLAYKFDRYNSAGKYDVVLRLVRKKTPTVIKKYRPMLKLSACTALMKRQKYQEALNLCNKCLKDTPCFPHGWYCKACIESLQGNAEESIKSLRKCLSCYEQLKAHIPFWQIDNYGALYALRKRKKNTGCNLYVEWAKKDEDLKHIRDTLEFQDLVKIK